MADRQRPAWRQYVNQRRRSGPAPVPVRRSGPAPGPVRRSGLTGAIAVMLLGALLVAAAGTAGLSAFWTRDPSPHSLRADTLLYDRHGVLIADLHPPGESRIPVPLARVSQPMQRAVVDIEDRNFWSGTSIDWGRMASAALSDLRSHSAAQGASTIPEQLAKIEYLNDDKSLSRKLQQVLIGIQIESHSTKPQILQDYLNDVYFGEGATGVESAARTYFGVPASQLDVAQASLLAALPNEPAKLDPRHNLAGAKARQRLVLDAMVTNHHLSGAEAERAFAEKLTFADGSLVKQDLAPAFTERVVADLKKRFGGDPRTAGLSVVTTLDAHLQSIAQADVTRDVAALGSQHVTDGALVSVDPKTGDVVAYVGSAGPGFPGSQLDLASSPRQPGSTFKVFTYTAAIQARKITEVTPIKDGPFKLPTGGGSDGTQPWEVKNYDLKYHGTPQAQVALGNSFNVPAVEVELSVGVPAVVQLARQLGISTLDKDPNSYGASLTLGGYQLPLWELAQAGAAFATGGQQHPARFVLSVKHLEATAGGSGELAGAPPEAKQVLDPGVAFIVDNMLVNPANRRLEFGAATDLTVSGHIVAAKTGTTSDNRDGLLVGWTPNLATATWVGNADNSPMIGVIGLSGAGPIWHDFMTQALAGTSDGWPQPPANVRQVDGNWFLEGTGPGGAALGTAQPSGGPSEQQPGGDHPGCRSWSYNGGSYWACSPGPSGLPGDPVGGD